MRVLLENMQEKLNLCMESWGGYQSSWYWIL